MKDVKNAGDAKVVKEAKEAKEAKDARDAHSECSEMRQMRRQRCLQLAMMSSYLFPCHVHLFTLSEFSTWRGLLFLLFSFFPVKHPTCFNIPSLPYQE